MEEKDIPQDESSVFEGQRKVIYATRDGEYIAATSNGWDAEDFATSQAVQQLERQTAAAWAQFQAGTHSALYYLMYAYRHDETSLAMAAGVFRWQLRRHFKPDVFAKLPEKTLAKYAQALQLNIGSLKNPPEPEALKIG